MDIEEGATELVEKEDGGGEVDEGSLDLMLVCGVQRSLVVGTYITQSEHRDRTDGMRQHPNTEDIGMHAAHDEIPEEVSQRETLDKPSAALVTPNAILPVCIVTPYFALLVEPYDPQGQTVDNACLRKADDVHVPVDPRPLG